MPIQSSFLIRCWLNSIDPAAAVMRYHIEHVQSGKAHQSASLEEILTWMSEANRGFVMDSSSSLGSGEGNIECL